MKGLTEAERSLLLLLIEANGRPLPRNPWTDELNAGYVLQQRGLIRLGPLCKCGRHPLVLVTPLGREVEALDRAAREPGLVRA